MNIIQVQLKKSKIRRHPDQKEALRCLGLKKVHQIKELKDIPAVRGQLRKVLHLVEIKTSSKKIEKAQPKKPALKKKKSSLKKGSSR